jgi:leucyl aminopeptidase
MKITFDAKAPRAEALVVFAHADGKDGFTLSTPARVIDEAAKGALTAAARAERFTGKTAQVISAPAAAGRDARTVMLVGLGRAKEPLSALDVEKLGSAIHNAVAARQLQSVSIVGTDDMDVTDMEAGEVACQLALAIRLMSYRFDKYFTRKGKNKKPALQNAGIATKAHAAAKKLFAAADKVAAGVFLARDLASEPPNVLYPESFAAIIKKEMAGLGVTVKILDVPAMKKLGMHSLLGVGQGSVRPPRLVTMEYNGGRKGAKPVALVGKGVTFDTGGISLKPGAGMEDMKWDMAGAGAVVGAMKAIAGRRAKANVVGVVALAENMPSGSASRPSDVVSSMSGQTIENLNTDAEGRLVLCDALTYTQRFFKPSHIVDLATLTGAVLIALGDEYAGLFSNDDGFAAALRDAGSAVGENMWQLPLNDAWDKAIDSAIADMKNISGSRNAGSAIGAHFLKRFIEPGVTWAHLDIAGMAWTGKERPTVPKGATAYGVRLLDRYVRDTVEG